MMARNPRWAPVAGDVLLKGQLKGVAERKVLAVRDNRVEFVINGKHFVTPIVRWREWAQDARVS